MEVQKLSKSYGKSLAVDEVSFLYRMVQSGPSGTKRSRKIDDHQKYRRSASVSGAVGIQGLPARSVEAKRKFAYVPEMPAMFDALSVREHIEYMRKAYNSGITDEEVEALLARFDLDDKQDKLGNELSKGMMQKVSICCALAIRPKVLLLDEPMVGLDPKAIKELKEVVLEQKALGVTVLISTHMLEMVEELWDMMFVMEKSKIIGSYRKDEVGDKDLDALFFEMTGGEKS